VDVVCLVGDVRTQITSVHRDVRFLDLRVLRNIVERRRAADDEAVEGILADIRSRRLNALLLFESRNADTSVEARRRGR